MVTKRSNRVLFWRNLEFSQVIYKALYISGCLSTALLHCHSISGQFLPNFSSCLTQLNLSYPNCLSDHILVQRWLEETVLKSLNRMLFHKTLPFAVIS